MGGRAVLVFKKSTVLPASNLNPSTLIDVPEAEDRSAGRHRVTSHIYNTVLIKHMH
jgi:hypothetical protein